MPRMYSPADLPSRFRAAPAKNRISSIIGGTSSDAVSPIGLPVFSDSIATISSARVSRASAILSIALWRSAGVVSRQIAKASEAALNALSTSTASDS